MNKTLLVAIGASSVSIALGVLGGVFLGKYIYEKRAEDRANAAIDEANEYLKDNRQDVAQVEADALALTKEEHQAREIAEKQVASLSNTIEIMKHLLQNSGYDLENLDDDISDSYINSYDTVEESDIVKKGESYLKSINLKNIGIDDIDVEAYYPSDQEEYVNNDDEDYEDDEDDEDEEDEEYLDSDPQAIIKGDGEVVYSIDEDHISPIGTYHYSESPTIIDEDAFEDSNDYDKLSYSWYAKDETLSDESNTAFVNRDQYKSIVGEEFKDLISIDNPIVYVRNDERGEDYEISYNDMSYADSLA